MDSPSCTFTSAKLDYTPFAADFILPGVARGDLHPSMWAFWIRRNTLGYHRYLRLLDVKLGSWLVPLTDWIYAIYLPTRPDARTPPDRLRSGQPCAF